MSKSFISRNPKLDAKTFWQFGKLATLYFDQTIYQLSGTELLGNMFDKAVTEGAMSQHVADELILLWKPADSVVPTYKLLDAIGNEPQPESPRLSDQSGTPRLDDCIVGTTLIWSALNALEPHALLTDMQSSSLIERLFSSGRGKRSHELFSIVASTTVPDLNDLPWETVLRWRHTPDQENRRKAMTEAQVKIACLDTKGAVDVLREIGRYHLRTEWDHPIELSTSFKMVVSTVPLSIPVHPVSTTRVMNELITADRRIDKLGWLYLLVYTPSKPKQDRRLQ